MDEVGSRRDSPSREIEVLIVDDHRTFADAIALALDVQPGVRSWGCVHSAEEAIDRLRSGCPDVVLLDVALPGLDGISAIERFRSICPDIRIVVLTANTTGETMLAAVDAGVDGFLPKEQPFADVLEVIMDDDASGLIADARTLARLVDGTAATSVPDRRDEQRRLPRQPLTEREYEILLLLADGTPVKQIAQRLDMSVHTCRGHVNALLGKLEAHSQLAAVITAARVGLLPNLRADGH